MSRAAGVLQTRGAPAVAERNLVGDCLPAHSSACARGPAASTRSPTRSSARRLLADLESLGGSVGRAFEAKAYGLLNGGAAAFEAPPTYGDDFTIFSSIFFNNYGRRKIHPDAGCVGWNWGAPFKLGCNCIFINGRTCICFASCVLNREILRAIRDHAQAHAGEPSRGRSTHARFVRPNGLVPSSPRRATANSGLAAWPRRPVSRGAALERARGRSYAAAMVRSRSKYGRYRVANRANSVRRYDERADRIGLEPSTGGGAAAARGARRPRRPGAAARARARAAAAATGRPDPSS